MNDGPATTRRRPGDRIPARRVPQHFIGRHADDM